MRLFCYIWLFYLFFVQYRVLRILIIFLQADTFLSALHPYNGSYMENCVAKIKMCAHSLWPCSHLALTCVLGDPITRALSTPVQTWHYKASSAHSLSALTTLVYIQVNTPLKFEKTKC